MRSAPAAHSHVPAAKNNTALSVQMGYALPVDVVGLKDRFEVHCDVYASAALR
jgi:hypothetical protein